jgi:hypothetical protein
VNKGDIAALKASGLIYRIVDERQVGHRYVETIKYFDSRELPIEIDHAELTGLSRPLTAEERKGFPAENQFWNP